MANDRRGWRLLSDLNNAFRRDPEIEEFDFIPVAEPKHNRSPIVLVDHHLGIELWSVKILYQYVYHTVMEWRSKKAPKFIEPQDLLCLTRAAVLINPECYTIWHIRKELVESGDITVLEELKLSAVVLTKHPKSSETFVHRKWLLSRFMENYLQSSQGSNRSTGSTGQDGFISMEAIDLSLELQNIIPVQNGHNDLQVAPQSDYHAQMKRELRVCTCAAEKYPCNYYAWSHRIWLLQHCYNCSLQILLSELRSTEGWVSKHVSDHCGFHYRQFLLSSLASQSGTLREQFSILHSNLLQQEFHFICDLVQAYPGHEAMWNHREQFSILHSDLLQQEFHFILDLVQAYPGHEAMWNHRKFVFHSLYNFYKADKKAANADNNEDNSQQKKTRLELDCHVLEQKEVDTITTTEAKSDNTQQKRLAQNYLGWMQKAVIK